MIELPRDVQETIFDLLPPNDRLNLNLAVPKNNAFHKTIKTSQVHNKKLGVITYLLKKKKIKTLPPAIIQFLLENAKDPYAQLLLDKMAVKLDIKVSKYNNTQFAQIDILKNEIAANKLSDKSIAMFENARDDLYLSQMKSVIDVIIHSCTPHTFQVLMENEHARNFVKCHMFDTRDNIFFTLINMHNEELLKYITSNYHLWPDVNWEEKLQYIQDPSIARIFLGGYGPSRIPQIRMLVECVHLPYSVQQLLLEISIQNLYMDVVEYLMNDRHVRLAAEE